MSQNWKDIGRISNSNTYKNVNFIKIGKNNIGKLRYFHNENRNNTRGSLFDISGVNEIIGIGTNKPFSRLSLGDISGSGSFDINYPGQLSAIALHEKYDGKEFSGVVFNNSISSFNSDNKKNAVQFIAIDNKDFSMNDINSGRLYLSEENITTIGGIPRKGPEYNQKYPELTKGVNIGNDPNIPGDGQTKIVLDVRGSIRTDGYLNFYNKFIYPSRTNISYINWESSYNITQNIPGSGIKRTVPSDYSTITNNNDVSFNAWAVSEQIIDYDPSSNQSIIWKNNVNFIDSNKTKDKYGGIFVGIIDASNTNIINNPHKIAFQYMNHALFDYGILGVWEYLGKKQGFSGDPWPTSTGSTPWSSDVPLLVIPPNLDEEKPIDNKDKLEIRIIGETQTVEYYSHIWNDVTGYNISLVYTSTKKLQETDYPFKIAAVIGLTNYGRKPATGLVVDVKTADGTGSSTLESITVTNSGSGYGVGGIITFVKVGDGTNPGDYNSFEYTLVAGDFENNGTIKIGTLSGLSNTIFNGGNATGATTTGVTPTGGSEPITNLPLLLKDQTEVTESLNNFFEDVAISTINYTKTTIKPILLNSDPSELFWENFNNINNIPIGSIWYQPKNKYRPEGLYYKSSNNGINRCVNIINDGPSTIIDGSALFKSNFTTLPEYIIQKSTNVDLITMQRSAGSVPVTFSDPSLNIPLNANELENFAQHYFKNTLTLREGNLSVCGITNSTRRVKYSNDINNNNTGNPLLPPEWRDICNNFGQIWSERQFLIGPGKANRNWAVIDSYLREKAPALLSTNLGKHIINPFKPIATNSIILGNWNPPAAKEDIIMTKSEAREIAISLGLKLGTDAFPFDAHPTSQTKGLFAYDWENENYGGSAFWGGGDWENSNEEIAQSNTDEYRPFLKTTHNYISDNDKILDSIGKDYDCTHSIIIGDISSSNINSPFSLISNLGNSTVEIGAHQIRSVPGLNINFGTDNNSNFSPFTLMIGTSNDINNKNNVWSGGHEKLVNGVETHKKAIDKGGGNIILGKNNQLRNTINWIPLADDDGVQGADYYKGLKLFNSNFVSGNNNKVFLSEYSFIDGSNNHSVGKSNTIFGKDNVVGSTINNDDDLSGNECHHNFVFGVSNKLTTSEVNEWDENSNVAPQNITIMGKNNTFDLSYNTDISRSYIILGSDVSNNLNPDLSNVRFAFGTYEKTIIDDVSHNGIVFSIDVSGNVDMSGSIIIGGKMVQGLGYLANNFSDVDISGDVLDISGSSEKHTIEWDNNYEIWNNRDIRIDPSYSHLDYIDLSFVDVASLSFLVPDASYNLFFDNGYKYHINSEKFIIKKNNDISGNDASFNSLFLIKDVSASHWYIREDSDISGNDASFNSLFLNKDISASHWYIREDGDISGNDASFNSLFLTKDVSASHWYIREDGDISGNDASFNTLFVNKDISTNHWYIREDGDISGNDASFNSLFVVNKDISTNHWYIREDGDISGNDASFNSLFLTKDISASHWYIREDGDISGNDASFNNLFVKDISASHWYIREDCDISGNDANFNKIVVIDSIIPATSNITIGSVDNPINSLYVSQSSIFMVKDGVATHKIEVINGEIEFNKVKTSLNSNNEIITETERDAVTLERFLDRIIDISSNNFEIYGDLSGSDIKILTGLQIPSGDNVILKNITISTDISNNVDISGSQGAKLEIKSNTFDNSWNIVTSGSFNSSNEQINALEILEKNNTNDNVSQFIIDASNNVGVNTNILDASLCVAGDISSNNLLIEKLRIGLDVFNNTSSEVIINGDISCNGSMQISNISLNKTLNNDVAVDVSGALICDIIEPLPDIEGGANSFAGIPEVGPLFLRGDYLINTEVAINTAISSDSKLIVNGDVFVNGTITQNTSDLRIKKNIFDVNKSKALEIVKNIPNKYYNYISKNISTECGFIAQDVKKHFPMAVTVRKNILIPSEYREINTNFTQVWFNESENTIVSNRIYNENGQEITKRKYKIVIEDLSNNSMDSKYRFYLDKHLNGYIELKPIETPKTFLFDSELDYLFVFGKYIDDFHALDKKQIFALHHGAIQEIENRERKNSMEIEFLEKENINLRKEIEILKNLASKVNEQIRNL